MVGQGHKELRKEGGKKGKLGGAQEDTEFPKMPQIIPNNLLCLRLCTC